LTDLEELFYNTISTGRTPACTAKKTGKLLPRHIGIDKLHIRIPLYPDSTDGSSSVWSVKRYVPVGNGHEIQKFEVNLYPSPRTCIHVSVFNHGKDAVVEFNPSRVIDKAGSSLCPVTYLEGTVLWVLKELESIITPEWAIDTHTGEFLDPWPSDWYTRVVPMRIDLAADINVNSKSFNVAKVRQAVSNKHKTLTPRENRGVCNSMEWGKRPWLRETFYNKGNHPDHVNSAGQFRFEVQAYREYIKKNGLRNLENLTEERALEIIEERWTKSGLSGSFALDSDLENFYQRLLDRVSPGKAQSFLGAALLASRQLPLEANHRTIKEYEKLGQSLGFSFGSDITAMGSQLFRLDLQGGEMVLA
jgi:hypothetical protein